MNNKETVKILKKAKKRINVAWHKGSWADREWNRELKKENRELWNDKVPVCATGAVNWAATGDPIRPGDTDYVYWILDSSTPNNRLITLYNDDKETTLRDINKVFRRAIWKVRLGY